MPKALLPEGAGAGNLVGDEGVAVAYHHIGVCPRGWAGEGEGDCEGDTRIKEGLAHRWSILSTVWTAGVRGRGAMPQHTLNVR